jgi:PAS domain S-box-containing protein
MTTRGRGTADREALYAAFADRDDGFESSVDRALDHLRERLGMDVGALTRIDGDTQTVERVVGNRTLLQPGEECPLEESYCRRTIDTELPVSTQNAAVSTEIPDAAYDAFGLQTYVGCRVELSTGSYGTVCFFDRERREEPFSETERLLVELVAQLVGQRLEQRRFEDALRERNERLETQRDRFQDIAENSFDIIYRIDLTGAFTYVSPAIERVLGRSTEAFIDEPFIAFVDDDALEAATAAFSDVLEGDPVRELELPFEDGDGERVWLEINATAVETDGEVTEVQGVARDVTARKARQEELRLKDRAIDDAGVGVAIADLREPDRPLTYVNETFTRISGYPESDVLGRNCRFLQGPDTDPEAVAAMREAIGDREPVDVEVLNYRRDGAAFWNALRLSPVADGSGTVTHYVGIQEDVTERKRREQLIRVLNRVLRHNLRNDMNVLLGYGERLAAGEADPDAVGERITERVTDLLELSERARELEASARTDRKPTRLDLDTVLHAVAERNRESFPESEVTVSLETHRDACVGTEVASAVGELVHNGLAHDDGPGRVRVTAADDGDWIEVTVADDGPGLPAVEADALAGDESSAVEHGDGLGLWLVNWTVTRYGGGFEVEADGDGTVATLRLPAVGPEEDVATAARRPTTLTR